jgi:glycosyltransferase involved in cell wall biosynthesis
MRIVLIADTYPPHRSSGAVQIRDLSREFAVQGHTITVIVPSQEESVFWREEFHNGVRVLRLWAPKTKDVANVRRVFAEISMPFAMLFNFIRCPFFEERWDGVVWYSPTIFLGLVAGVLKAKNKCKSYLIIRDIFPEWAFEMGLIRSKIIYNFFKWVACYQYSVADTIGVQSLSNLSYFHQWKNTNARRLEVLNNWLGDSTVRCSSIRICDTILAGRKVFVYAGNVGIAQGLSIVIQLALRFVHRNDVGFLVVGRGSDLVRLKKLASDNGLKNLLFYDQVHPDEIRDLFAQCCVGIVALDPRHKTHNIPGKFLSYMQCGLPVLANINRGNDLGMMIRNHQVGQVCEDNNIDSLFQLAQILVLQVEFDFGLQQRCRDLFYQEFMVEDAVKKIVNAISE